MVTHGPAPFHIQYKVRPQELGPHGRLSFPAMINLLQDAAWYSAAQLGASVQQMNARGIAWVLSRLWWQGFSELPGMEQQLTVETYPSGYQRSFVFRDFRVFGENGTLLGQASSTWVVMNLSTRRMERVTPDLIDLLAPPAGVELLPRARGKWDPPATWSRQAPIQVGWHDLDLNGHVNHSRYLAWLGEALPDEQLSLPVQAWDIQFRGEATRGHQLLSEAASSDQGWLHRLRIADRDEVLVMARSRRGWIGLNG